MYQIKNNIHLHIKNRIYSVCLLFFILTNCSNPSTETAPDTILNEEQFTKILSDFLISESAINLNIKNINNLKFDSIYAFNPLKENNVSKAKYDSTIQFYSKHPELYKQIYEATLEQLSLMQIQRKAKSVNDSLQAVKIKQDSIKSKHQDSLKAAAIKNKHAK